MNTFNSSSSHGPFAQAIATSLLAISVAAGATVSVSTSTLKPFLDSEHLLPVTALPLSRLSGAISTPPLPCGILAPELMQLLRQVFGEFEARSFEHVDPDEGWTRTVLTIDTGRLDVDEQFKLEDRFYTLVDENASARRELKSTIISFQ